MAQVIDTLPTAPSRKDGSQTFSTDADAWVAALELWTSQANILGAEAEVDADNAERSADDAAISAADAQTAVTQAIGTSVTSVTIGLGAKTWTTQTGQQFIAGQSVRVSEDADPVANFMLGTVTDYITGTGQLDVFIDTANGSGTFTAWSITTVAQPSISLDRSYASALVF